MARKKVVIGIPSMDTVSTMFAHSLTDMILYSTSKGFAHPFNCAVQFYSCSLLPFSRQILAQYVLDMNFTHLLFIDSDMSFPHWMLSRLLERHEPVIGINAMSRRPPYRCTALTEPGVYLRTDIDSKGLVKVYRTGFGVMWIAAEVFRKMPEPWFDFTWLPEKKCFMGEDYYFCEKVRQLGYDIWVDQELSRNVEHVGSWGFTPLLEDALNAKPDKDSTHAGSQQL